MKQRKTESATELIARRKNYAENISLEFANEADYTSGRYMSSNELEYTRQIS